MMYAVIEIETKAIEDMYDRTVASVYVRNSKNTQLHIVSRDNTFLCYRVVRTAQFPAVTIFGLAQECTWQTCLEISNQAFAECSLPPENQCISLFLDSYKQLLPALDFFEENGFKYFMSHGSDNPGEHDFLVVQKVVPVISRTRKILQMVGLG